MSNGFEWLDWLEASGPFLAAPVLKKTFPQGLETLDPNKSRMLRQAFDEYRQAFDDEEPEADKFHTAWIDLVLKQGLEYDEDESGDNLHAACDLPDSLNSQVAEHGVLLKPSYAVVDDQSADKPLMLIQVYDNDVDLNAGLPGDGWASSPRERMVRLCRNTHTRLGLVTNGNHWLFVDAPVGSVSSFASWYAHLWSSEPILLQAFVSLLGIRRFFLSENEHLPALIDQSVEFQDEVTEALGEQVRRAVEVLIQALDKADVDRNRELLRDVDPRELYEAGLTVMMRLVFLLSAEERDLLLLGDERYEANYAVSTLRMQLRGEDDTILQHRWDAWSRLLAIFRAIYGGIEHETLRMPALGGSLFDPDRFPFLEGRDKASSWQTDSAKPLPIDNQTVLLLLDAIQLFEGRTLSYRGLNIEQLGYVYEGLLEHTVKRVQTATLQLNGTKNAKQPWVTLEELQSAKLDGKDALHALLKDRTGSAASRIRNDLKKEVTSQHSIDLLTACHNSQELHDELVAYFYFMRTDRWGRPLVYPEGSFMVTRGEDRRQSGSHYTPISLTEEIVETTLEPVVYIGPAVGDSKENWKLRLPAELLDLKICDPAMGSGAFLVQICRWLGERLVESWGLAESEGRTVDVDGVVHDEIGGHEPLPLNLEERTTMARRLVAERCIYGVDINPLAVELAKLSIWLITLSKGRPFGFLDHNLRSGDSLLGIHDIEQIIKLHPDVNKGDELHAGLFDFRTNIQQAVEAAIELRLQVRTHRVRDISDVQEKARLNELAQQGLMQSYAIADAITGEALANPGAPDDDLVAIAEIVGSCIDGDDAALQTLRRRAGQKIATDIPTGNAMRKPFHWILEYPEVFLRNPGGFDVIVGNPPFLGGQRITGALGTAYRNYLVEYVAEGVRGSADLVTYFYLQAYRLVRQHGHFGLLAVNTIAEGDTRQVGLERLVGEKEASIHVAYPNEAWPGKAAVVTSRVHIRKGKWNGVTLLNGQKVEQISAFLSDQDEWTPMRLVANAKKSFQGSIVLGSGFTLSEDEAMAMIEREPKNQDVLFPYLNGKDLNSHPEQKPSRWVINFFDWSEEKAKTYEEPYKIVLEKVKSERLAKKKTGEYKVRKPRRERWWQHAEKQPALYHAIGRGAPFESHPEGWDTNAKPMRRVIVFGQTSKTKYPVYIRNNVVLDQKLVVITDDSAFLFSQLCSSVHYFWAWRRGSTLKKDPVYTPTDVFETFPFLAEASDVLGVLGEQYDIARSAYQVENAIGLTDLYNNFHDSSKDDRKLGELRELHHEIDKSVLSAYGWDDIKLSYGFHEYSFLPRNDCTRFTISEKSWIDLLRRLSQLNEERYYEEVSNGLHEKKKGKTARSKKNLKAKYDSSSGQKRDSRKRADSSQKQMDAFDESE